MVGGKSFFGTDIERIPVKITTTLPYAFVVEMKKEGWKPSELLKEGFRMKKLGGNVNMRVKQLEQRHDAIMAIIAKKSPSLAKYISDGD